MPPGSFRLQGKTLFLTYPQCHWAPNDAAIFIRNKLNNVEWTIWGREKHADGSPHLHAIVSLSKRCDLQSPNCLDLAGAALSVSHGDYRVARDPKAVLDYVTKDGDIFCDGTTLDAAKLQFATAAGKKRSATETLLEAMSQGKTILQAAEENPGTLTHAVLHQDKILRWHTSRLLASIEPPLKFVSAAPPFLEGGIWDSVIATWLMNNMTGTRVFGKKQLWIAGPTMVGKTTFANRLAEMFRIYWVPDEDFYDDYVDQNYDLIVFDEYRHQKTILWMNRFCDGSVCPLRQKGRQTVKRINHPIIVLSNFRMRECYPNVEEAHFDTLKRRFEEVWVERRLEVGITSIPRAVAPIIIE